MWLSRGLLAVVLSLAASAPPAAEEPDEVLDEIIVVGEQPGPGLWKVSKGDNVMWVLANHRPLHARVKWNSRQVEARIAESQEVLYPPNVSIYPSIGLLRAVTLLPSLLKTGKNPGGARLQEVLPPDVYARWLVLSAKYPQFDDDEDPEKWRPSVAMERLRGQALVRSGLANRGVDGLVGELTGKHKVRVRRLPTLERAVKVEKPGDLLKAVRQIPPAEIDCFTRTLDALEPGIERAKVRATAWMRGDIPKLRELFRDSPPRGEDCILVTMAALAEGASKDASRAKKIVADMLWHEEQGRVQAQRDWVAAAQLALQKNRSTVAVLPVSDVLGPNGHLEKLRVLGYTVEEPL